MSCPICQRPVVLQDDLLCEGCMRRLYACTCNPAVRGGEKGTTVEKTGFESWAIVELMGHTRIAGKVSEAEIGGGKLLRVDVPEIEGRQPLTKYFGTAAIYALNPVDEETARLAAREIDPQPVAVWSARRAIAAADERDAAAKQLSAGARRRDQEDEDLDEPEDDNIPY